MIVYEVRVHSALINIIPSVILSTTGFITDNLIALNGKASFPTIHILESHTAVSYSDFTTDHDCGQISVRIYQAAGFLTG